MKLSNKQLEQYKSVGFLVLKDFVSADECDRLRARAEQLVAEFDPNGVVSIFSTREQTRTSDEYFLSSGDKIRFFFEENAFDSDGNLDQSIEQSVNKIGHALHDLDPMFSGFSRAPKLAQLVSDLGVDDPLLIQSMYIFKQPNIGGEVTCHQDSTFLYTDPIKLIGMWFALEDATIENGCLWAIRGGHKAGLKSRFKRDGAGGTCFESLDQSPWQLADLVPLEVEKGTLIVLDGLLPHLSRANNSSRSRPAYTLHVIEREALYPAENWLQRDPKMAARGFSDSAGEIGTYE